MALIDKLTALGDAIREQTGGTEPLTLDAMAVTIRNLDFSKTTPINVVPSTNSSFTYNGTSRTPVWQNFNSEQLTISGNTSATNAGTYTVYFTPKAGYTWADESVDSKAVTWSIAKATGTLSLSATSGEIYDIKGTTKTFTVNYNGDGVISVKSSNTTIVAASISGKTVTLTSVGKGSATITVSIGSSNNYTTPSNQTYSVDVDIRLYLYKLGDKCTSNNTGTWTAAEKWKDYDYYYQTHVGNPITPTITWNSNHVVINCGNGATYRSGTFYKNKLINFSDYTKITFDGLLQHKEVSLYVWSSIGNLYNSEHVVTKKDITNTSRTLVELPISSLNGSYYVGFGMYGVEGSAISHMYQLYLS